MIRMSRNSEHTVSTVSSPAINVPMRSRHQLSFRIWSTRARLGRAGLQLRTMLTVLTQRRLFCRVVRM
jgi:hypothetical protein